MLVSSQMLNAWPTTKDEGASTSRTYAYIDKIFIFYIYGMENRNQIILQPSHQYGSNKTFCWDFLSQHLIHLRPKHHSIHYVPRELDQDRLITKKKKENWVIRIFRQRKQRFGGTTFFRKRILDE